VAVTDAGTGIGTAAGTRTRLVVDWVRCQGSGVCAELLPELVELDDWGFPMVKGPVPPELTRLAERARAACPSLALRLAEG
jgi:ferredoxin